jgi:mannose-6-phosphate isomerase-like protein (cupin superfamily)
MRRTSTTSLSIFSRKDVTMSFQSPPGSSGITTLTLPPHSLWTSGLHWHETHTEYLQVTHGVAFLHLDGIEKIVSVTDGILTIPRYARHEWRRPTASELKTKGGRASGMDQETDIALTVKEWTDPDDGQKEVFFRNLNSAIIDITEGDGGALRYLLMLQLFVIFQASDNYPVVWSRHGNGIGNENTMRAIERAITHIVLRAAVILGWVLGLRGIYADYTPVELLSAKNC